MKGSVLMDLQSTKKSLSEVRPDLAEQWHPTKNGDLTPNNVSYMSNKKAWWFLSYDDPKTGKHFYFEWEAYINNRSSGHSCPYCSNRKVLVGYNDLTTTQPELAAQWNFDLNETLLPTHVTQCSHKKVWWKCDCGHIWMASVSQRSSGCSCPICAAKHRGRNKKNAMAVKRVGEMRMMSCGLNAKIITYSGYKNINIQFENGIEKQTSYDRFKKGAVSPN